MKRKINIKRLILLLIIILSVTSNIILTCKYIKQNNYINELLIVENQNNIDFVEVPQLEELKILK